MPTPTAADQKSTGDTLRTLYRMYLKGKTDNLSRSNYLQQIQKQNPTTFDVALSRNTDANLRLQEMLAFEMGPWARDAITQTGMKDAPFNTNVPLGSTFTGDPIRDAIMPGALHMKDSGQVALSEGAIDGYHGKPPQGMLGHEYRHRVLPNTPVDEYANMDYNSAGSEEDYNRKIDYIYKQLNPYNSTMKTTPPTPKDMDYFNEVIKKHVNPNIDTSKSFFSRMNYQP